MRIVIVRGCMCDRLEITILVQQQRGDPRNEYGDIRNKYGDQRLPYLRICANALRPICSGFCVTYLVLLVLPVSQLIS